MSPTGSFRSLADWLAWLETLSPTEINLGLERIDEVLGRLQLDLPERVIHVAGTNGKGSSVAMLESLLLATGDKVGSYTSPHVFRYNERIRVNGEEINDDEIVAAFEAIEAIRQTVPLTYFEYGTAAALRVFAEHHCDALVLEVGLGGRLDAVNAVEPQAGLITNIALDHCDWLGNDVESIAWEKAGIMRSGRPLVFGSVDRPSAIDRAAKETGAHLICTTDDFDYQPGDDSSWAWSGKKTQIEDLAAPSLAGSFQIGNAAAVLALLEAVGLDSLLNKRTVDAAFSALSLPGRFQRIRTDRDWILDVAHNPHAAEALGAALRDRGGAGSLTAIVGALDDKDVAGIVGSLVTSVDSWIAVTASAARAVTADKLAPAIASISNKPCLVADSIADALEHAVSTTTSNDTVLVTGSFYVVGPAIEWIRAAG
jgi:dihydrofolate synthase/folylpolyglutamate synthase